MVVENYIYARFVIWIVHFDGFMWKKFYSGMQFLRNHPAVKQVWEHSVSHLNLEFYMNMEMLSLIMIVQSFSVLPTDDLH
jgi:hypothetical protein